MGTELCLEKPREVIEYAAMYRILDDQNEGQRLSAPESGPLPSARINHNFSAVDLRICPDDALKLPSVHGDRNLHSVRTLCRFKRCFQFPTFTGERF
jgi:hypothetical protein